PVTRSPGPDVGRRVTSAACAIRYFLSERHPDLASSVLRWVESIVVFTHPLSHVEASDAPATIVRYSQLYQTVLDLSRKHRVASGTAGQLARTLAASRRSSDANLAEGDTLTYVSWSARSPPRSARGSRMRSAGSSLRRLGRSPRRARRPRWPARGPDRRNPRIRPTAACVPRCRAHSVRRRR